jgi:hypothetical protein
MTEPYEVALNKAQKELVQCNAELDALERKQATLQQTVAVLQSVLGIEVPQEQNLTESILMAIKGSLGYMKASQVTELLGQMGHTAQQTSVATILSRLSKSGKIIHAVGPDGITGYAWKTEVPRQERTATLKTLARKPKGQL